MKKEVHIWLDSIGFKENYPGEYLIDSFLDTYRAIDMLHRQVVHTTITYFFIHKYNRRIFIHYDNMVYEVINGKIEGANDEAKKKKNIVEDILILDDFD